MDVPSSITPKRSSSNGTFSSACKDKSRHNQQEASYQIFRNNSTEVEVVVKDVSKKGQAKKGITRSNCEIKKLQSDNERLRNELSASLTREAHTKKVYGTIVTELRRQLKAANRREPELYAKNTNLELENEKLKVLLDLNIKITRKIKVQLLSIKKILRFVVKSMRCSSANFETLSYSSDMDYEDFEKELKRDLHVRFNDVTDSTYATFNSSLSREIKLESMDNRT